MSNERIGRRPTTAPIAPVRPAEPAKPAPQAAANVAAAAARVLGDAFNRQSKAAPRPEAGVGARAASVADFDAAFAAKSRDVRDFGPYIEDQGDTNGCGTTSLAANLSFWKGEPGAYTRTQIDRSIRFGPDAMAFTSPANIEQYARQEGFRSKAVNGASMDDLKGYLDQGVPVQVLYDPNNKDGDTLLHYVNVVGYNTDADGNLESLKIADPATGKTHTVDREEFEARWNDLELGNVPTGLSNVMLVHLPGENTPIRTRDGKTIDSDDIELPEGGMGFSGAIADLVSDGINGIGAVGDFLDDSLDTVKEVAEDLNPVSAAKSLWGKLTD